MAKGTVICFKISFHQQFEYIIVVCCLLACLQHDNAIPPTAHYAMKLIQNLKLEVLPHQISSSLVFISIQPEGQFWQEPEPSQATGVALAHCILGSFLGVGCHCFPPPSDIFTRFGSCNFHLF